MKLIRMASLGVFVCSMALGLCGCARTNAGQECWHERLSIAATAITDAARTGNPIGADELRAWIGEPDGKLSAASFVDEIQHQPPGHSNAYARSVANDVADSYASNKSAVESRRVNEIGANRADVRGGAAALQVGDSAVGSFERSTVWVYAERARFTTPKHSDFGFFAFLFVVDRSRVVVGQSTINW